MEKTQMMGIRWAKEEWDFLGAMAKMAGISRSELIRSASTAWAQEIQAKGQTYFLAGTKVPQENTRIGFFSSVGDQKVGSGRDKDASPGSGGIAKQRAINSGKAKRRS